MSQDPNCLLSLNLSWGYNLDIAFGRSVLHLYLPKSSASVRKDLKVFGVTDSLSCKFSREIPKDQKMIGLMNPRGEPPSDHQSWYSPFFLHRRTDSTTAPSIERGRATSNRINDPPTASSLMRCRLILSKGHITDRRRSSWPRNNGQIIAKQSRTHHNTSSKERLSSSR